MIHRSAGNWSKNLRINNNDDPSNKSSCDTWIYHFAKLFSIKGQFQRINTDFEKRLGDQKRTNLSQNWILKILKRKFCKLLSNLKNVS